MNQQNLVFPSSELPVIDSMPTERKRAENLLLEARKRFDQSRYFEAMELIDESLSLFRIGETLFYRGLILVKINKKKEALSDLKEAVHLYDRCLNAGTFYQEWLHTHIPACLENFQIADSYIEKAGLLNLTYEVGFDSQIKSKKELLEKVKIHGLKNQHRSKQEICDDILDQIKRKDEESRLLEENKDQLDLAPLPMPQHTFRIIPEAQDNFKEKPRLQFSFEEDDFLVNQQSSSGQVLKEEVDYNLRRKNYKVALFIVDSYLEKKQDREGFVQRCRVLEKLGRKAEAKAYALLASQFKQ